MFIYTVSCRNPYEPERLFVLFLAAERPVDEDEALAEAIESLRRDGMGHEWVEAVAEGTVGGPLEVDGKLIEPSIAVRLG